LGFLLHLCCSYISFFMLTLEVIWFFCFQHSGTSSLLFIFMHVLPCAYLGILE
jgi:hypothetical protein